MGKYFGTDGIRGEAFVDLTEDLAFRVGKAAGYFLRETYPGENIKVCVGKDTRISGDVIERSLVSGFLSSSVSVRSFGIIPTPAVSRLTYRALYHLGVVISASHNPVRDNGIKLFNADGYKLTDAAESRIEELMDAKDDPLFHLPSLRSDFMPVPNAPEIYIDQIIALYPKDLLKGLRIIVDLAHGATYFTTPTVLRALGATVTTINDTPDGNKINVKCGSTNPENIKIYAQEHNLTFDAGFAHDGDGDRVLAVDSEGHLVDGDMMMSLCAIERKNKSLLGANGVVGTIMTNEGIVDFLKEEGIELFRSKVGDKYVLRDMKRLNYTIGGEQSGHIIFTDLVESGDGLVTMLEYLKTLVQSKFSILEKIKKINFYHQLLTNLKVQDQKTVINSEQFKENLKLIKNSNPDVRINVRASGTEPLIRILTEARTREKVDSTASQIAKLFTVNQYLN
jgi:phosphoglucosamine mutase